MYKLLIVDDEFVEIEALEYVIKNSDLPIGEIKSTHNGRKAISIAESFAPDFVLMDIKMPGISGTQAAAVIKDHNPNCKVVFLTAYNYFNYAKDAIELNASGFLIKPVADDELIGILNKLIIEVEKESLNQELTLNIKSKFKQISSFFENELINYLIFADIKEDQINEYLHALGCTPSHMHVLVMAINENSVTESSSLQETMLRRRSLKVLKENFAPQVTQCFGNFNKNYIYMLINTDTPINEATSKSILHKTITYIKDNFLLDTRVVISDSFDNVMDINQLLLQHKHTLLTQNHTNIIVNPQLSTSKTDQFSIHKEKLLLESVRINNKSLCLSICNEYVQWLNIQNLSLTEIKYNLFGMLTYITKSLMTEGDQDLRPLVSNYSKKLEGVTSVNALFSCFTDQLLTISQLLNASTPDESSSVIQKLCKYIDIHFKENISLKELADDIHMNSQYISKLFKEETGINFSDYLTNLRIKEAKKLISSTNQSMKEISIYVGYNDSNYFTRAFKKHESITPKEYRLKSLNRS